MKVLKEGKWKMKWEMEKICSNSRCGATLLIEEADVKPVHNEDGYFTICAICKSVIAVPRKTLPPRIQEALERKRKYSCSAWD